MIGTIATSPNEVPTSARRLSITSFELPRYTTLVSGPRTAPVRFRMLLTTNRYLRSITTNDLNETATYEHPKMTNVNPITTPVLDSPNDQPISPNVYDGPTIIDYSNPTRLMFAPETIVPYERNRHAANDGEVTAVHGADEIRTILVDEPETPELLLRAYDDLRGLITRPRQATIDEIPARVVSELTKRLVQTDERVDDERARLRARLVKT